jgi:hypothetical protein
MRSVDENGDENGDEWRGFASSTVLVAAIVHRRAIGGKEEMQARFDPTFASDLTGRGFVGFFLGLKAQASCCRAFSPSDRVVCYSAFSLFRPA